MYYNIIGDDFIDQVSLRNLIFLFSMKRSKLARKSIFIRVTLFHIFIFSITNPHFWSWQLQSVVLGILILSEKVCATNLSSCCKEWDQAKGAFLLNSMSLWFKRMGISGLLGIIVRFQWCLGSYFRRLGPSSWAFISCRKHKSLWKILLQTLKLHNNKTQNALQGAWHVNEILCAIWFQSH